MFIAVSKTVGFNAKQQEEINNAFKAVDDRITNTSIESIDKKLPKKKIDIIGVEDNYSSMIGNHEVNLLFKLPPHSASTLNLSIQQLAKQYGVESTTTTGNTKLYYVTEHNISFVSDNEIKRVRAVQYQTNTTAGGFIYFTDNSYDQYTNTTQSLPWLLESYDLIRLSKDVKWPTTSMEIKLAREDNNYSTKYYYAKVDTSGNIRIMDSCEVPLYFNLMYVTP